jgi:tetratricopeptide (TPR) repeat protein
MHGLELTPDNANLLAVKGAALFGLGRHADALAAIAEASGLDPGNGSLMLLHGIILRFLDRSEEALSVYRRASELQPDHAMAWYHQADVLIGLGRPDEAEPAALRAVELEPDNPTFSFILSEISFAREEFQSAVRRLREALQARNEDREAGAIEAEVICALLWDCWQGVEREGDTIDKVVAAYAEAGAGEDLGRGLVESAAWLAESETSPGKAEAWVAAWASAPEVEELQIPLRMLSAAREWKKDQDRAHLLVLPPEQREILIGLLTSASTGDQS